MEDLKIAVDGITFKGKVKIEGENTLKFTVYYNGQSKSDEKSYKPRQTNYLMIMARQTLFEMVSQDITVF